MDLRFDVNMRKYAKFIHAKWQLIRVATYNINYKLAAHYISLSVCPVELIVNREFHYDALRLAELLTKTDVEIYLNPNTHLKMFLFESEKEQHVHLTSANFTETKWAEFDLLLKEEQPFNSCVRFFNSLKGNPLTERIL